ncbi:MAG TPA: VWA domain-containing protein [Thermoanaerobaculia bacterium]|nr:VWA domain-containing protein [Thermoanaerobaculia bacterium]
MKRPAIAAAVTFAFATTILAQTGNPPAPAKAEVKKPAPPGQGIQKLSRRERRERIAKLGIRFQDFLADVEPILQPTESDTFLALETDAQRDAFVDDFWRRRDALQGTANRAFRDIYYARLEIAKSQFKQIGSDRARIFLLHGPPAEVVRTECQRLLVPIEIWKYPQVQTLGYDIRLLFFKARNQGDYKLWNPIGGNMALAELLVSDNAFVAADEAGRRRQNESSSPYSYTNRIQLECQEGDEILRAITQMVQSRVDLLKIFDPPRMNEEDAQKILRSLVITNPNAPKLSAEFSVRFPSKDGSRTDVQMMLLVPRAELTANEIGGAEVYNVDVTGEILKDGELWEKYRYRFDFPGDFKGDKLPIVVDRLLRPAEYVARVKVIDPNSGAEVVVEQPLSVPEIFTPEPIAAEKPRRADVPSAPGRTGRPPSTAEAPRLRIVPPEDEVLYGIRTIETIATGSMIKAVEFSLDGRKVAVRRAPPFSLDFDFGSMPQMRRIRAVALDGAGKPVAGDDLVINTGTDPFRVRITSPRIAPYVNGPTRVDIDVRIPEDEELNSVELYWNQQRVATMFDPPFVHTVDIPATDGVGYLRVVATVKDTDVPPVEDVVLLNTPAYMEELNVHFVELPTTVTIGGKPTNHLTEKAFSLFDEGKPVSIAKFDYVKNLPLSIGLTIDTSGSMQPRIDEARKAGAQFLQNVMKKGDKAFLVSFDREAQVVQKWSNRIADIHAGLGKLRAEESTALYDAVVYSLYNFLGLKGQRALVLITDGRDTASKFNFDQSIEYARRAAVPIYPIGIGIRSGDADVKYKLSRFANETGGTVYYVENAGELERVYKVIESELRSQYVLGFYPSPDIKAGSKWRELEVKATEGKVKTIRGYYP